LLSSEGKKKGALVVLVEVTIIMAMMSKLGLAGDKPTSSERHTDDITDTAASRLCDYYDFSQR
jgi:hypothetical protein